MAAVWAVWITDKQPIRSISRYKANVRKFQTLALFFRLLGPRLKTHSRDLQTGDYLVHSRVWEGFEMGDLIWLSGAQIRRIQPYFPLSHGVPRVDERRVISGIIFVIRNGLRWRDAPKE